MTQNNDKSKADSKSVENLINQAMKKLGLKKENDICRYLPGPVGGYIHHFTMRKMKTEKPEQLTQLINKNIVNPDKPTKLPPKPRAARGSRKRRDQFAFSKQDLESLLTLARTSGNRELVRKLMPKKDIRTAKRELISSIRHGRVEPELWHAYAESATVQNASAGNAQAPANNQFAFA
jgi:hypothetical protein